MKTSKKLYCRTFQAVMHLGDVFMPWRKPQLLEGAGAVAKLPDLIKSKSISRILLVTDKALLELKLTDSLQKGLENAGIQCVIYAGVQPNPTIDNVEEALALYKSENCQGIIGFGGGSSMDCAKACGARVARPNKSISQMKGLFKVTRKLPPFFTVPTTAGTGSETTVASIITDPVTHCKYAINDLSLISHYAVLDPLLTTGLPGHITSTTGMDALTHAVEAYIGRSNNDETRKNARAAVKLIFENLYNAYIDGSDIIARENMLKASFLAGTAFTRAYVGYVHAIAHTLGGLYGVPHGYAIAVIQPQMLRAYGESVHKPLSELADLIGLSGANFTTMKEKSEHFIEAIEEMNHKMGIPAKFTEIKKKDIPLMAKYADAEANPLYPVPKLMDKKELEGFIETLMEI
ncbi:MAG: iron-containing alcohol dehydrogenase [Bacillota bacterium]